MISRITFAQFYAALVQIQQDINKKIPLAPNRNEQFETCPASVDLAGQDEIDRKYLEFEKYQKLKFLEFQIFDHLNTEVDNYIVEHHIASIENLSAQQKTSLKAYILNLTAKFAGKLQRAQKILKVDMGSPEEAESYICTNIDSLLNKLYQGEKLEVDDKEMAIRAEKSLKLSEHRQICRQQLLSNSMLKKINFKTRKANEYILKVHALWEGIYFDDPEIDVGFCDEHACIGIKRIFEMENKLAYVKENIFRRVERVSISYEEGDGHAFLAINRSKSSKLNLIETWGDDAILFDPWNKLVCMAKDYPKLDTYYFSFPDGAKWRAFDFCLYSDHCLLIELQDLNRNFAITGNLDSNKRQRMIEEEYELISLQDDKLKTLSELLYKLLKTKINENYVKNARIYLTTSGTELVRIIPGMPMLAIAVHLQIFAVGMNAEIAEEIRFGMAYAIQLYKRYGLVRKEQSKAARHLIDSDIVRSCRNGEAGIRYIRKSLTMYSQNRRDEYMSLLGYKYFCEAVEIRDHQGRIKNLMTLLASDPGLNQPSNLSLDQNRIDQELKPVGKKLYFSEQFTQLPNVVEKIKFLTIVLPELKKELMPYELIRHSSVRVREFCSLLMALEINLNNLYHAVAIDELVDAALKERVHAFERIYVAINKKLNCDSDKSLALPALGKFKNLQLYISEFVAAENYNEAVMAAQKFSDMFSELKSHFGYGITTDNASVYTSDYLKRHHQYPTGADRYFSSEIGWHIVWKSFEPRFARLSQPMPWDRHVGWALEHDNKLIAHTLMRIGVCKDERLWSIFNVKELEFYRSEGNIPIVKVMGHKPADKYIVSPTRQKMRLLNYISAAHVLDINMFADPSIPFEQAYCEFYDRNMSAISHPNYDGKRYNLDTPATEFLLMKFAQIAKEGTEAEKTLVKSFFIGRNDKRDYKNLFDMNNGMRINYLNVNCHYFRFVAENKFQASRSGIEINFKQLLTGDEILAFLVTSKCHYEKLDWRYFCQFYKLSYQSLDLKCLNKLLDLLTPYRMEILYNKLVADHITDFKHQLLSKNSARLFQILKKHCAYLNMEVLASLQWNLPASANQIKEIDWYTVIGIYRIVDTNMVIPSHAEFQRFSDLVVEMIESLTDADSKIKALEKLLFVSLNKMIAPLSSIKMRNWAVATWVKLISEKYGKDDGSEAYFNNIVVVIDRIKKNAGTRDETVMMSHLANEIVSQWRVSEHMGIQIEPEKFVELNGKQKETYSMVTLATISSVFANDIQHKEKFLHFISTRLTPAAITDFAAYILDHDLSSEIYSILGHTDWNKHNREQKIIATEAITKTLYHIFWDRSLKERAIMIDYLIIPTGTVCTDEQISKAYQDGFVFIAKKLFPNANIPGSDDEFALSFLKAYLDVADKHLRSILLAGLLVASNETGDTQTLSVGKKLAMLCEHLGPAYIKLAQAIHSHPKTPESIRRDLEHVKAHANPPHRWQLWRMIREVLPREDREKIKYVGRLIGSASYNLAIKVKLANGRNVVLSLLREDAEKDARCGFDHLRRAINICNYPKMQVLRPAIIAMLSEAELLSKIEMSFDLSRKQYVIASEMYVKNMQIDGYNIRFYPTRLLKGGVGYRFIDLIHGIEFNDLAQQGKIGKQQLKTIAKAQIQLEFINILRGGRFDSDRHGNQMRILIDEANKCIEIGLYDFGEISLEAPTEFEINQFAVMLEKLPMAALKSGSMGNVFDDVISAYIDIQRSEGHSISYLMRIRKALLALQDFQKHLSTHNMIEVLVNVLDSKELHPVLKDALTVSLKLLKLADLSYNAISLFKPNKSSTIIVDAEKSKKIIKGS